MKATLGGERLGSGKKMEVELKDFGWSNHNLSRVWRSSMPCGVAYPSMKILALPGDQYKIRINALVRTKPTVGPLYGSFEMRTSVFSYPIRLAQGALHSNPVGIGLKMDKVKMPLLDMIEKGKEINGSSIAHLLNYKGDGNGAGKKYYNAVPMLAYYDICKNYYINKQEPNAKVIVPPDTILADYLTIKGQYDESIIGEIDPAIGKWAYETSELLIAKDQKENGTSSRYKPTKEELTEAMTYAELNLENSFTGQVIVSLKRDTFTPVYRGKLKIFAPSNITKETLEATSAITIQANDNIYTANSTTPKKVEGSETIVETSDGYSIEYATFDVEIVFDVQAAINGWRIATFKQTNNVETFIGNIKIEDFPIENLDKARQTILDNNKLDQIVFISTYKNEEQNNLINYLPYTAGIMHSDTDSASQFPLTGLMLTTYKSDINNNWLETEMIDGSNGIAEMTAIDITDEKFYMDTFLLKQKMYNQMNRVLAKGNTFYDWCEATYEENNARRAESPIYEGGASGNIVFEEVVSTSETETAVSGNSPIGTLAGRGTLNGWHDGEIEIKVKEPSYIMAITTITPHIDYSQGTDWDNIEILTMDDLHKPALDGIGFQNLMAYTMIGNTKLGKDAVIGKQPAYINYMTAVNETHGTFAGAEMFMTLNRKYESDGSDFTTYINPEKFNYAFAETNLSAENFWVQIGFDIEARRKMSAKIIPNL